MSWPGCLCVLLPLPVCQLSLCGAGLWSQIYLLHLADVHTDFMVERKREGENERPLVSERCCAPACMGVKVCCMFNEANWSRVSRMHTRLMAWLQPCDTKQSALVCLCVCAGTMSMCGNDASVTQLLLSNMCV